MLGNTKTRHSGLQIKNRLPAKKGLTTYYVWHIMQEVFVCAENKDEAKREVSRFCEDG